MKSRKPRLFRRHAAHSPAMPPPTITMGNFSVRPAFEKGAWSRRRCPAGNASLTKPPSIFGAAFAVRPIRAALRNPRRLEGTLFRNERELGDSDLVVALDEESEWTAGEVATRFCKRIEQHPLPAGVLDLVNHVLRRHFDLNRKRFLAVDVVLGLGA